ncbi:enoyl-CoA hydratase [Williamsia muralis]|uniref:Enoyl-CoA hydratase n=1 Tax=Williamsia marianensis TaxID=85044 RepID=A0ABU4F0M6_WILMA|nr:enoyl-CoA hydratase [Williamsia muralis]MDV7136506.1 enoyl-CoA hydratase [Williamsia muralis]
MTSPDLVLIEQIGAGRLITLNRPEARNALSQALNRQLIDALAAADTDADTSVILLAGAGGAFCAGMDLKELAERGFTGTEKTENCIDRVSNCRTPVIGLIDGPAVTGGFELALACDFLIASQRARFADTHARVGIVPGGGLTARLAEVIGVRRARQMSGTGQYIDAATALRWGLVNEVVESAALRERGLAIAEAFTATDPATLAEVWQLYDAISHDQIAHAVDREAEINKAWSAQAAALADSTTAVLEHGRAQNRTSR